MYERSYGSRYGEPGERYASAATIAKMIRRDIKNAIAKGERPGGARNYSVRSRSYSGGQAIDIVARDLDGMWEVCPGYRESETGGRYGCGVPWCKNGGEHKDSPHAVEHKVLTREGKRIEKLLQGFHDAYNHDGSEIQVDYFDKRYWGRAEIDWLAA